LKICVRRRRVFSAVGLAAEDVVGFVEDHFADFVVGEGAVGFGLLGGGGGVGIVLFFEVGGDAGEAGESVELPDVVNGVVFELVGFEGFEDLEDGDLKDGLVGLEAGGVGEVGGVLAKEFDASEPVVVLEPGLEAVLVPIGDVFAVEGDAVFGHFGGDGGVGYAVVEHLVDEVALVARELGDFAFWSGEGGGLEEEGRGLGLGRGGGRGGLWCDGGHRIWVFNFWFEVL